MSALQSAWPLVASCSRQAAAGRRQRLRGERDRSGVVTRQRWHQAVVAQR
jgi:hypothetical protein